MNFNITGNPMIIFRVEGQPVGKARARTVARHGFVQSYTPQKTRDYETKVKEAYIKAGGEMFPDEPLGILITAYFEVPKSYSKKKTAACHAGEIKPTGKPDLDNIAKLVLDALNGVAFKDDSRVCKLYVGKHYAPDFYNEPGLSVIVCRLEDEP